MGNDITLIPQVHKLDTFKECAAAAWGSLTATADGVILQSALPKSGKILVELVDAAGGAIVTINAGKGAGTYQTGIVSTDGGVLAGQGSLASNAAVAVGGTGAVMTIIGTYVITSIILTTSRFKRLKGDVDNVNGAAVAFRITTSANIKCRVIALP